MFHVKHSVKFHVKHSINMSIVQPIPQQTEIWVYRDIPWDNSYKDIRLFRSQLERNSYLEEHKVNPTPLVNFSVIKLGESIKVTGRLNDWIWVTYMSFQNKGLTVDPTANNLRYYCFVTAVNYINVNCVELVYEVDWIQTYLYAFRLGECIVEREHVNDDTEGLWLADEHIDTGEYMLMGMDKITYSPSVMVWRVPDQGSASSNIVNNVVTPCEVYGYDLNNLNDFDSILNDVTDDQKIPIIAMGVTKMIDNESSGAARGFFDNHTTNRIRGFGQNQSALYVARNNKLNCFPYCLFTVDNYMGSSEQYYWEECSGTHDFALFDIEGVVNPRPCLSLEIYDYKGGLGSEAKLFRTVYDNFPIVPYAMDTYKRWISEQGIPAAVSVAAGVGITSVGIGMGVATGGALAAGAIPSAFTAVSSVTQLMQEFREHKLHNRQYHGGSGTAGVQYQNGEIGFRITQYAIKEEVARRIDAFFDRYGYRVDVVKVPNLYGRVKVNYVKTRDAEVHGIAPQIAKETLARALNNGVSFWHINEIGEPLAGNPISIVQPVEEFSNE